MSGPTVVVLPASGDDVQRPTQDTSEIASTIQQVLHERTHPEPEHPGPFKQILADPESLYKYINWSDPILTLGVYMGALSILFGAHYLPLTQLALKGGVTALGVVSATEFASRLFAAKSVSARLRPKEYKKVPESTLNATLKDIHDFIQYAVVQAQRIVFGEDLDKSFLAFLGLAALYWLTTFVPPFWLAVMGLTSIFIAPLAFSPQGRQAAYGASVHAQELANVAAQKGKVLAQNGKDKAIKLSSNGKQTAADLSAQARGTASNLTGTATENIRKLPQMGANTVNKVPDIVSSAFGNAKGYVSTSTSNNINENSDKNQSVTDGATSKVSNQLDSADKTAKQMAPETYTGMQPHTNHPHDAVSSFPAKTGSRRSDSVTDAGFEYRAPRDTAFEYGAPRDTAFVSGIQDQPRGPAPSAMDRA